MPTERVRIQQLEHLATEQGQAIESVARGLANLTVTVKQEFAQVNNRLNRIEGDVTILKTDVAELKTDVAILKTDVAEIKTDVAGLKTDVASLKVGQGRMQLTLDMLLAYLRERL